MAKKQLDSQKKPVTTAIPVPVLDAHENDFQWELGENVVCVDSGNGKVSAWRLVEGKLQHVTLPNARVPVRGTKLSRSVTTLGTTGVLKTEFMGILYGVGEGVWELSEYPPETFSNSSLRYGSEHQICMTMTVLALLDIPSGSELTLITSAPPGLVNSVARRMQGALTAGDSGLGDGWWHVRLRDEREERAYRIRKTLVVPEGVSAYAAFAFDANGNNVLLPHPETGYDLLSGNVFVADGGMGTFDGFFIRNGRLNEESIEHATDPRSGIQSHLITPIMDYIRAEFDQTGQSPPSLNQAQVDGWLKQWAQGGRRIDSGYVVLNGLRLNIHAIATRLSQRYARWLVEEKLEPAFRQGADAVLLAGGAWVYTLTHVLEEYPKRNLLYPAKVAHLKGIDFFELNAYGGLPLAANNKKVHRRVQG